MNSKRVTLNVDGMTCGSCEARVTKALHVVPGVITARASAGSGRVVIEYDAETADLDALKRVIEKAGYPVRGEGSAGTVIALGIGLLLIAAYLIASARGLFSSFPAIDANVGYAMLFVIGGLTSIHCVAMCGGLALSQSVGTGDEARRSRARQLRSGLLYNAGRVASYTAIGAAVGALGSTLNFSPVLKGVIAALAGVFMLAFGLKMLGVLRAFPSFGSLVPSPLRSAGAAVSGRLQKGGPFAVGILNGLMPCGPLQTMQLYALGTGSAIAGAVSMLLFSLGTVPLMLIFSLTAALLPRKVVPVMIKASAVLVMFLGVVTFARAATYAGVALPAGTAETRNALNAGLVTATLSGGRQTVLTEFKNGQYVPFVVKAGVPLTWTIRISADDLNSCNETLVVPSYNIKKDLVPGDNVVEFTPTKAGKIAYSCWMGMVRSSITVAESLDAVASLAGDADEPLALPGGGGCCSRE